MTNLVQILTARQFRVSSQQQHLLAAGYGPAPARWDPGTICARQLWGCSAFPAQRPPLCHRDAVHCLRFKSSKRRGGAKATAEDSDEEGELSDEDEPLDPEPEPPEGSKDLEKHVQSLRFDVIMKAGLDVARNKIEDGLYDDRLRLNGQRLVKKSRKVKVGDTLDLILSEDRDARRVKLKRVILRKVLSEAPEDEKVKVSLRRWKFLELPSEEVFKSDP